MIYIHISYVLYFLNIFLPNCLKMIIILLLYYILFYCTETFTLALSRLRHRKLSFRRVSWHVYRKYISVKWSQGAAEVLTDSCRPFCEYY